MDLVRELTGMLIVGELAECLGEVRLDGSDYPCAHLSLAGSLRDAVESLTGWAWTDELRAYLHRMAYAMERWSKACKTIAA